MKKEFVPYELALRMKQLGFDEPCFGFHSPIHDLMICNTKSVNKVAGECLAPTYSAAFRWFREKYDLHHVIHHFTHKKGTDEAYLAEVGKADDTFSSCKTYEEAELACLDKLIEIVEQI